jgi:hypothetical protein
MGCEDFAPTMAVIYPKIGVRRQLSVYGVSCLSIATLTRSSMSFGDDR